LDELDARVGEGVGILSLANRLVLGARICIGNILDTEWGQVIYLISFTNGDKTFYVFHIYSAQNVFRKKTIETYDKR
jgi:hypothetical protein